MQLKQFLSKLEEVFPVTLQESWDNCGLLVGSTTQEIERVLVTLDVTDEVVNYAMQHQISLIVAHHPLIFKPIHQITSETTLGKKLLTLISNNIAVISMHTNVDKHPQGLNRFFLELLQEKTQGYLSRDCRAMVKLTCGKDRTLEALLLFLKTEKKRGLIKSFQLLEEGVSCTILQEDLKKVSNMIQYIGSCIKSIESDLLEQEKPIGGIGDYFYLKTPISLRDYCEEIKQRLNLTMVRVITPCLDKSITTVAVVTGSGSSFWKTALSKGVDLLITGDVTYHDAQEMREHGLSVMDIGHFESEKIFDQWMKEKLSKFFSGSIECYVGSTPIVFQ